ncbi:putative 3-phosphoshikimate 1-carboxyvinyltransferase [Neorickettsia risticii str. Illinois]|uniref:3-phosphoshikimate 1-carboxyvinyltransferase n=1 Tax=Neorickettsia risticii (strain Illinois) TaxID=434131 RepID=C6V451_NEORI|nr:3-phosphoshikimate 1-carboxyvinyltransferase [Neorickettsia risticii]ACT69182.1 putative 3-phosphoshikimate 1-carboxyvinyltransferase [Neorickettsia risticii str. Illinois]
MLQGKIMNSKGCKIEKIPPMKGIYSVPPDVSMLQSSIFVLAHAMGRSTVSPFFAYDSVIQTIHCLEQLGVRIKKIKNSSEIEVYGIGLRGFHTPANIFNIGSSHMGLHLLLGSVATYSFQTIITGSKYQIGKLKIKCAQHFADIGIEIVSQTLPTVIKGCHYCIPHEHILRHSCSQSKSALLMAGLNMLGTTTVIEPFSGSRDHLTGILEHLGADVKVTKARENTTTIVHGGKEFVSRNITIPGDPSMALFLVMAATLLAGSAIIIKNVYLDEKRLEIYKFLKKMGANIEFKVNTTTFNAKIGEIHVKSTTLNGITINENDVHAENLRSILFLLCTANGKSCIENPKGLKITQNKRFMDFVGIMQKLGANIKLKNERIDVGGTQLKGNNSVSASYDQQLGNLLTLAGFITQGTITVSRYHPEWLQLYYNFGKPTDAAKQT